MKEFNSDYRKSKNKKIVIVVAILLLVLIVGTSFALWQLTFTQTGTNVITTGCLSLTLTEDTDAINLVDATPTSDEDGKKLNPFTFTLTNTCTTETSYVVNLETLSSEGKMLADKYVKASLNDGSNEVFIDNLLDSHINLEKVISEASVAYKLYQGKLGNNEKISFNLRLWMDEDTEALNEVMEASWQGKITVTATYVPPVSMKNVMKAMEIVSQENPATPANGYVANIVYTRGEKYVGKISRVVFESKKNPYTDAVDVVDFSEVQDSSVLGYYVENKDDDSVYKTYTLYIQADGKIKANPIASYYGLVQYGPYMDILWVMEGLENLDTSLVTTMEDMFSDAYNTTSIDLSSFDTSNVINMNYMFSGCYKINTTLTIRNKDVTYDNMFNGAATEEGSQITLNYTADTESVVDAMIANKPEGSNVVKGTLVS